MTEPTPLKGRGAWTSKGRDSDRRTYMYELDTPKDGATPDVDVNYQAVWYGVKAIQQRTNDLLTDLRPIPVEGLFGPATSARVKIAQQRLGLEDAEGEFGRNTAKAYWKPIITHYAEIYQIDPKYTWGMMLLESSGDPGAVVGVENPGDFGLAQINHPSHPALTLDQIYDPYFALEWQTQNFAKSMNKYKDNLERQLNASILHHNTPTKASAYYKTGEYPNEHSSKYVNWVKTRAETYNQ